MQQREERERQKLNSDIERSDRAEAIQWKIDYLESLIQSNTIDPDDLSSYKDLLKDARLKYLDLLS
jgi:hypothetical protein